LNFCGNFYGFENSYRFFRYRLFWYRLFQYRYLFDIEIGDIDSRTKIISNIDIDSIEYRYHIDTDIDTEPLVITIIKQVRVWAEKTVKEKMIENSKHRYLKNFQMLFVM